MQQLRINSRLLGGAHQWRLLPVAVSLILSLTATIGTAGEFSKDDLKIEQPEKLQMEWFTSELVPIGGASSSSAIKQGNDTIVHEREFVSPQAKVQIECQKDKTVIRLNFSKPFSGIVGAGNLGSTRCKVNGDGGQQYLLGVMHNETGCGTQWDSSANSIINTLFVRFHPSLETGNDLAKNIMCRLSVGDLIVGRRPARRTQSLRQRLKPSVPESSDDSS